MLNYILTKLKVGTSNFMRPFENYQSYNNESGYNSNKDKDLVIKNIVKTIYQRPFKVEKNPVSEMYYISKNNAKKKNNTPCNLKKTTCINGKGK